MPLRSTPKGLFLHLRVTPKAGRDEIMGLITNTAGQKALAVKVARPPDNGEANKAVIELLAKSAGVAKSSFRLAAGQTSRDKTVEILHNADAVRVYVESLAL